MATNQKWRAIESKILAKLDIASEYAGFGVEITSDRPNSSGWVSCWAADRPHGNSPSAAINIGDGDLRGRYSDRGGTNERLNFWEFAAKYGSYSNWREARKEFAKKTGLSKQLPKSDDDESLDDKLEFVATWNPLLFRGLLDRYAGISEAALRACGAVICKYPKKSPTPRYCVALPGYGPAMIDGEVRCYTIMACDGGNIGLFQGEGKPLEPRKRINLGPSGMLGKHGLLRLDQSPVIIWKVEGVSDLLALQTAIPEELRDLHLVITNASGTHEVTLPGEIAHCFAGLKVAVIHDADKPGQQGAALWLGALAGVAADVRNVQLPFEIAESHGKDLRDWLNEGHTYDELLDLWDATESITKSIQSTSIDPTESTSEQPKTLTSHQMVLERLGIVILGEIHSSKTVMAYSQSMRKMIEIRNLDKYKIEHLIMDFGEAVLSHVSIADATETKMSIDVVRRAIAAEAGKRRISDRNQVGVGAWLIDDQLYLVNAGEIVAVREKLERYETPRIGKKLVDFGESSDQWFNFERLSEFYAKSESQSWCQDVLKRAASLFDVFESLVNKSDTELIVSSLCASYLQTVWGFRPQIVISGPTNCGKSWLLSRFIKPMLGELCLSCDKPSEAGVRQAIGHTAKVVVIDEFERSSQRQVILDFIRLAARGGTVTKGTNSGQKGIQFHLKHMLWMAGIENGLSDAADRNRVILVNMQRPPKDSTKVFTTPSAAELNQIGLELFAVTLRHWRSAEAMSRQLIGISDRGHDSRLIESHAAPVAIWGVVHGWDRNRILDHIISLLDERDVAGQEESDEGSLLELILGAFVTTSGGTKRTVASLLDEDLDPASGNILEAYGVSEARYAGSSSRYLFFRQETIKQTLLRDTKWKDSQIDQILLRVPGSERRKKRFGSTVLRGISIPVESILDATESVKLAGIASVAQQEFDRLKSHPFG